MVLPVDDWSRAAEPPPAVVEARAPITSAEVERGIGVELAQKGVQLAELGVRISYARDANGEWLARVQHRSGSCDMSLSLGRFDELSPARRRVVISALEPAIQTCANPISIRPREATRWVGPVAGVLGVASATGLVGLAFGHEPNVRLFGEDAASLWFSTGLTTVLAGSTATFFVPRPYQPLTLQLGYFTGAGMLSAGLASAEPNVPTYGFYTLAAGHGITAVMLGLDAVGARMGEDPTRAHSIPAWLRYSPAALGSLLSAIPAFDSRVGDDKRQVIVLFGAGTFATALLGWALADTRVGRTVQFGGGPGGSVGMSVGGRL